MLVICCFYSAILRSSNLLVTWPFTSRNKIAFENLIYFPNCFFLLIIPLWQSAYPNLFFSLQYMPYDKIQASQWDLYPKLWCNQSFLESLCLALLPSPTGRGRTWARSGEKRAVGQRALWLQVIPTFLGWSQNRKVRTLISNQKLWGGNGRQWHLHIWVGTRW